MDNYLAEEMSEYPLEQCDTCMHRRVCGLLVAYADIAETFPISLETAICHEYLQDISDTAIDEPMSNTGVSMSEFTAEQVIEIVLIYLEKVIDRGLEPDTITMNTRTLDLLNEYVVTKEDKMIMPTQYGHIQVLIDDKVGFGLFIIRTKDEEGEDNA